MESQLSKLPSVERLSPACIRILGGNPGAFTLQGTNTYLLGTGRERLLIDTGEGKPSWIKDLQSVLEEEKASVRSALITHWHHDHQNGVKHLLEASPTIDIYKNQPTVGAVDISDGGRVPMTDIVDGQEFEVEGASLTAIHTPGHTVDHMAFLFTQESALFTGDNVLGYGTAVFEDLGTYLDSLNKMKTLFTGCAYPGHGPVIPNGPAKIAEYIQHRQKRQDQVLQILRSSKTERLRNENNAWTIMELVKVIYADIPENLHHAAAGGVLLILKKLEKDGSVSSVGRQQQWMARDTSTLW